jgi:hypothetical protein
LLLSDSPDWIGNILKLPQFNIGFSEKMRIANEVKFPSQPVKPTKLVREKDETPSEFYQRLQDEKK